MLRGLASAVRLGIVFACLAACGTSHGPATDAGAPVVGAGDSGTAGAGASDAPSYHGVARPIVEARCVPCHREGGIAPFSLETYDALEGFGGAVRNAVLERVMPPLPADTRECRPLSDARVMLDEEREALVGWVEAGMHEGSPDEAPAEPLPNFVLDEPLGPPTSESEFDIAYQARATGEDDYRCIVVDPGWTGARILEAVAADPDNTPMVHHVILYAHLPDQRDAVDALDAADEGPGYECFGGPGFTGAMALGGYVPGSTPRAFAGGATVALPAGTRFVLQMHYNFLTTRGSDRTKLAFWEVDAQASVRPAAVILVQPSFLIPAGDENYSVTAVSRIRAGSGAAGVMTPLGRTTGAPGLAYGVGAHMHTRGKSVRVEVVRRAGATECLLDIPHWDFHWQGQYRFAEAIRLEDGDDVRMTCTWDNSKANQPVVDGMQLEPKPLRWGEGTLDEMCLGSVLMTSPK
jgi:hypothetical protein